MHMQMKRIAKKYARIRKMKLSPLSIVESKGHHFQQINYTFCIQITELSCEQLGSQKMSCSDS
jgi:hypothetical protein